MIRIDCITAAGSLASYFIEEDERSAIHMIMYSPTRKAIVLGGILKVGKEFYPEQAANLTQLERDGILAKIGELV